MLQSFPTLLSPAFTLASERRSAQSRESRSLLSPAHLQHPNTVRIAVLISGQMRTADKCAASILQAFPTAEFYIHAVLDNDTEKAELFKPVRLVVEPQFEMPERKQYSTQIGGRCHGVQRVLKQLDGLKKVWLCYLRSGHTHDVVVRCRADIFLTTPPETFASLDYDVYIPTFSNFRGYNDRFAIMKRSAGHSYFSRLDRLDAYIDSGGVFHPERFLKWSLSDLAVGRTQTCFYTLRADGTRDKPVWRAQAGDILHGEPNGD